MVTTFYPPCHFGGDGVLVKILPVRSRSAYLLGITVGPVMSKWRLLRPALASLPLTALVMTCHAAGEFVGYIFGPGNSPQQLA
jgi:hypothetical protein